MTGDAIRTWPGPLPPNQASSLSAIDPLRTMAARHYICAMTLRKNNIVALAAAVAFALLGGCEQPINDPVRLDAIKAEAHMLMQAHPIDAEITQVQLPPAIANLEPELVTITPDGVHILTRAGFDGGWGYFVPRTRGNMPEPAARFEEAGQDVYFWRPY